MKRVLLLTLLFAIFLLIILFIDIKYINAQVGPNQTMSVGVNLIGFSTNTDEISIEVPDYIDLGNVSKSDPISDEKRVNINNTGTKDIRITPILKDGEEEIFKWLFFRTQMSDKDGILNISHKIGDYSLDLNKPSTGKAKRSDTIYMKLNLTDFDGVIHEDALDYRTQISFIAVERV